jgi:hypothetical protein
MLNTLSEFSPNDGLHFLVRLPKPLPEACKSEVEMYCIDRFMTFTFGRVPNTPLVIATRQIEIESLYAQFKGKEPDTLPLSPAERVSGGWARVGVLRRFGRMRLTGHTPFINSHDLDQLTAELARLLGTSLPQRDILVTV